jgi:hypothetical protein
MCYLLVKIKNTGASVYISISGDRLADCVLMGIEVLDVLVEPITPTAARKLYTTFLIPFHIRTSRVIHRRFSIF